MEIKWNNITEKDINNLLDMTIEKIFEKENIEELSNYEKRKIIYDYLVENKKYNEEYFAGILSNYDKKNTKMFSRNLQQEFLEPLISNKGICNGFSQLYKVLLEKIGIFSYCINCMIKNENSFVGHQLNLVYDYETETFSFDDITFGIIKNTKIEYFDYDLEEAINKEEKQGYKSIHDNTKWMVIDESIIDYYMKRNKPVMTAPIKLTMNEKIENIDDFKRLGINIQSKKSMFEQIRTI